MNKEIYGLDLSLNHWAICKIDYETGDCLDYKFLTNTKSEAGKDPDHSILLTSKDTKNGESAEIYSERRKVRSLHTLLSYLCNQEKLGEQYVSLEGYAYSAMTQSLTQIAEIAGCVKYELYQREYLLRIHDPLTVKLYATGKGVALKKTIVEKARSLGLKFPDGLIKVTTKKKKVKDQIVILEEYDGAGTDIADAFFLGQILRMELMLRDGRISIEDLSEQQRKIFIRVTKPYPVNILSRPFITDNYETM